MIRRRSEKSPLRHEESPFTGIVLSCRVRLIRNLEGEKFPEWATSRERKRVLTRIMDAVKAIEPKCKIDYGTGEAAKTREPLSSEEFISHRLMGTLDNCGAAFLPDNRLCVTANDIDHVHIDAYLPHCDLGEAWRLANELDTRLDPYLDYAWSPKLGYLTANPTELGTGLLASVVVHLIGLKLLNELDPVLNGLDRLQFSIQSMGENDLAKQAHIYQLTNKITLGCDEPAIIQRFTRIANELFCHELRARIRLMSKHPLVLLDYVGRAFGCLQDAWLLSLPDCTQLLAALRFAVSMQLLRGITLSQIDDIGVAVQTEQFLTSKERGHLQEEECNARRADFLRECFSSATLEVFRSPIAQ